MSSNLTVDINNPINKAMAALNLSAYKLAAISGVSVYAIYDLQKGQITSRPKTYAKVITAMGGTINPDLFIQSVKIKRKKLGMSMMEIAKLSGLSYRTFYRIESDGIMPTTKTCCIIAKKLGLPIEKLTDWPS